MRTSLGLASLSLLGFAACSTPSHGANGTIDFVPNNCGNASCSFDDRLAQYGTTDVYLDGIGDFSAQGLHIDTSDPSVAMVVGGHDQTATLYGNAPGSVDLLALDDNDQVVDYTTIQVAAADELSVDVTGQVDGPHATNVADQDLYFTTAGTSIDLYTHAMADGSQLMGQVSYDVVVDSATDAAIDAGANITSGTFHLTAPAGEHDIQLSIGAAQRIVHFSAN